MSAPQRLERLTAAGTGVGDAGRIACLVGLRDWQDFDDNRLVRSVESGLPLQAASNVAEIIDPSGSYLDKHRIVPKSSYHKMQAGKRPLSKDQGEQVIALAKVFLEVYRIYKRDYGSSLMFLIRPHPLLEQRSPLEVALASTVGADAVLDLLARADAGVAA